MRPRALLRNQKSLKLFQKLSAHIALESEPDTLAFKGYPEGTVVFYNRVPFKGSL